MPKLPKNLAIGHLVFLALFFTAYAVPSKDPNHGMALLFVFLPDPLAMPVVWFAQQVSDNVIFLGLIIAVVGTVQWWLIGLGLCRFFAPRKRLNIARPNQLPQPTPPEGG